MVFVSGILEERIFPKMDFDFVRNALADLPGDYAIIFACTDDDDRKNDKWKKNGTQYHRIVLPWAKAEAMSREQLREWMLQLAKERLGLTEKAPAPTFA